jgi:hypothetical protein
LAGSAASRTILATIEREETDGGEKGEAEVAQIILGEGCIKAARDEEDGGQEERRAAAQAQPAGDEKR